MAVTVRGRETTVLIKSNALFPMVWSAKFENASFA
jgi:hypothetical protein